MIAILGPKSRAGLIAYPVEPPSDNQIETINTLTTIGILIVCENSPLENQ